MDFQRGDIVEHTTYAPLAGAILYIDNRQMDDRWGVTVMIGNGDSYWKTGMQFGQPFATAHELKLLVRP